MFKFKNLLVGLCLTCACVLPSIASADKACDPIVKACKAAGYTRDAKAGHTFWKDCMKHVLLGKSVDGVKLDAAEVNTCKEFKLKKMHKEMEQLKASST